MKASGFIRNSNLGSHHSAGEEEATIKQMEVFFPSRDACMRRKGGGEQFKEKLTMNPLH